MTKPTTHRYTVRIRRGSGKWLTVGRFVHLDIAEDFGVWFTPEFTVTIFDGRKRLQTRVLR